LKLLIYYKLSQASTLAALQGLPTNQLVTNLVLQIEFYSLFSKSYKVKYRILSQTNSIYTLVIVE